MKSIDLTHLMQQFKTEASRAISQNICVECKKPPRFYSEAGRIEYQISGLCEYCFDAACPPEDDFPDSERVDE